MGMLEQLQALFNQPQQNNVQQLQRLMTPGTKQSPMDVFNKVGSVLGPASDAASLASLLFAPEVGVPTKLLATQFKHLNTSEILGAIKSYRAGDFKSLSALKFGAGPGAWNEKRKEVDTIIASLKANDDVAQQIKRLAFQEKAATSPGNNLFNETASRASRSMKDILSKPTQQLPSGSDLGKSLKDLSNQVKEIPYNLPPGALGPAIEQGLNKNIFKQNLPKTIGDLNDIYRKY